MKSHIAGPTLLVLVLLLLAGALVAAPVGAGGADLHFATSAGSSGELAGNNAAATSLGFQTIYVSTSGAGKMGGLRYAAADILAYDVATEAWSLYFDGSDVGLTRNVNNFAIREFGTILMTVDRPQNVPGVGIVQPQDILLFSPMTLGEDTTGTWQLYFDGSDMELTTTGERLDALAIRMSQLLVSTQGNGKVDATGQELTVRDDDVLVAFLWELGANTAGYWQRLRDVTVLPDMVAENITGLYHAPNDPTNYDLYVSFANKFNVGGVKGQAGTIVHLVYDAPLATYTAQPFWDARQAGLVGVMDGFDLRGQVE